MKFDFQNLQYLFKSCFSLYICVCFLLGPGDKFCFFLVESTLLGKILSWVPAKHIGAVFSTSFHSIPVLEREEATVFENIKHTATAHRLNYQGKNRVYGSVYGLPRVRPSPGWWTAIQDRLGHAALTEMRCAWFQACCF